MKKEIAIFLILLTNTSIAGPPYDTDDPEPVMFHHWEVYFSTHFSSDLVQREGTAPHFEVNYGVVPNVQIHIIAPLAFSAVKNEPAYYGYGDTEIGFKYRFVKETYSMPSIGIFPLVELPSGNPDKGLGSGSVQVYLPVWIQKSFGKWTTYGGVGYWINPGKGNRNWQFYGWQIQYQLIQNLSVGTEIYHQTASEANGDGETRFNFGAVFDMSETSHLLFSAGSSINGSTQAQCYIGYQLTFGRN